MGEAKDAALHTEQSRRLCVDMGGRAERNDKVEEPDAFKFEGVEEWGQKELHPFSANADILHTSLLRTGGKDTKWRIRRDGRYRLTVNILKETVKAEYLGE